jgi:hypothetical protein
MDYLSFRLQGLCTSTGVVEAGCKAVVGARLSSRFEIFWKRRTLSAA